MFRKFFIEFIIGLLYKRLSTKCQFYKNRLRDEHILLIDVN